MENLKELSDNEKNFSYSKYYYMGMAEQPEELLEKIAAGPVKCTEATIIEKRNDLLQPGYLKTEVGYCVMDNGTAFVANITKMPGVTKEMFEWWFVWHGLEPLRYKIWDRDDHFGVETTHRERLLDESIPMNERIWGVTHTVVEDTGAGPLPLNINFKSPEEMGFDMNALRNSKVLSIICANGDTAVMVHSIREIPNGVELRSRFWLGYNIVDRKLVKLIPDGVKIPQEVPEGLIRHNVKEFSNLAKILPSLYEEEKDNYFKNIKKH